MRILNISAQKPDSTGSGTYLAETVTAQAKAGCETAVICGIDQGDKIETLPEQTQVFPVEFMTDALPFHVCGMSDEMPYASTRYRDLTPAMVEQFETAFVAQITQALEDFKPDVVLCHHLYLVTAITREQVKDLPVAAICHSTDLRQMAMHSLERDRIIAAIKKLDAIFSLNDDQDAEIVETYGVDPQIIHTAGTGYNAHVFNQDTAGDADEAEYAADDGTTDGAAGDGAAAGTDDGTADGAAAEAAASDTPTRTPGTIVYVGKISFKKGVESLLAALDLIQPEDVAPYELSVKLVGGHNPEAKDYQRIASLAPKNRWPVELTGRISTEDLVRTYRESDVFVLPSFYEGMPLVGMEALACGCKVVMTALPGIPEGMETLLPQNPIRWVEPPAMVAVDTPEASALPAYEQRLAKALIAAVKAPTENYDTTHASWEMVVDRILTVLKGL